jgi:two-component system, chemotaxis family, sensor kinase Cph1
MAEYKIFTKHLTPLSIVIVGGCVLTSFLLTALSPALAIWVLYIPLICLTLFVESVNFPLVLANFASAWLVLDLFLAHRDLLESIIFIRRLIGAIDIFSVAAIVRYAIIKNQTLKKSQATLELEKSKLARLNNELEQFTSIAAHDLRAPIKSISLWSDLARSLLPAQSKSEVAEALDVVKSNAKRANALVNDILELSRIKITAESFIAVDTNEVVRGVLRDLADDIKKGQAKINVSELPTVLGNPSLLTIVFENLLSNAIKYRDPARPLNVTIEYRDTGDQYEFRVKDNGIGINPQYSERIFEMFNRVSTTVDQHGTGIGLASSKKVVELCHGKIWFESTPGKGSTFFFTYPKKFLQKWEEMNHETGSALDR